MCFLSEVEFTKLKPSEKSAYFNALMAKAETVKNEAMRTRRGRTQGSAFLWISVYGKSAIARAFRAYLKKSPARIIENYRGTRFAYYLGVQSDLGLYDGYKAMASFFNDAGIESFLCDEWD